MDDHSLRLLEFDRVLSALASRADTEEGRARLSAWRPIPRAAERTAETALLDEAIRRHREPGPWCATAPGRPGLRLEPLHPELLDGPGLVEVRGWLDAAADTRAAWDDEAVRARHPRLAARADEVPALDELRARLARSLEPDGRVADAASPRLARARRELAEGERKLQQRLEKWARGFGESSYVTRHGERFVALVPAAGFPRRRGLVHDVSGSGQSLFVEPVESYEDNNRLIELRGVVADEERLVLRELADAVRADAGAIANLEAVLVHFDTLRARARFAGDVHAIAIEPGGDRFVLREARHPLLALGARRDALVPLELELGTGGRLLLVSGPNMGGKTVLLKTVGLAAALAHAALPVPAAEGSRVPNLSVIEVDLGDEQSVDQGLSTFAAHLRSLAAMTEQAGPESLLLCDELGAGTDPEEGAALGRALLEHFAARGAWGVLTTHLGSLKRVAGEVDGVVNGSLAFDPRTMTPQYRFLPGVPGASHALAVAERLGFPPEVVARARALAPEEARALERLLEEVQEARARLDAERAAFAEARSRADREAEAARIAADESRRAFDEKVRGLGRESDALLARARELWQTVQREARRAERKAVDRDAVRAELAEAESARTRLAEDTEAARRTFGEVAPPEPVQVAAGRRVRVRDLGVEAEVVSGPDAEGKVVLRRGSWNIQSHVSRLEAPEGAAATGAREAEPRAAAASWEVPDEAQGLEADLRGMEVDEALRALDQALDRAVLHGFGELRVIHGVGRGILRAVVERHLRGHPQVASQRLGGVGEGGRGVTVVRLR